MFLMMVLVPNVTPYIRDTIVNVREELKNRVKYKALDFLKDYDIDSIGINEGEFVNISFRIVTRKNNHLCLRILKTSKCYEYYLVSIPFVDVDYFVEEM